MRYEILSAAIVGCILLMSATAALAGDESRSYGGRVGYGDDPDQFVCGLQADVGEVYRLTHFVPSIDAGFGNDVTTLTFNGDLKVYLPLPKSTVMFYGLAGPAITIWSADSGGSDTEIGAYLGLGARMGLSTSGWYNLEARFGIGDVPDLRIMLGVLFGGR